MSGRLSVIRHLNYFASLNGQDYVPCHRHIILSELSRCGSNCNTWGLWIGFCGENAPLAGLGRVLHAQKGRTDLQLAVELAEMGAQERQNGNPTPPIRHLPGRQEQGHGKPAPKRVDIQVSKARSRQAANAEWAGSADHGA